MLSELWRSAKIFGLLSVITGIIYPWMITVSGNYFFPDQVEGSVVRSNGKLIGSKWLGQKFESDIYFHSRPSAVEFETIPSGAGNLGPTSQLLISQVEERRVSFLEKNKLSPETEIPVEMLFASGSGLDPHISRRSAELQMNRVADARHFSEEQRLELIQLIKKQTETPQFMIFGEERINVLLLNLAVDAIK